MNANLVQALRAFDDGRQRSELYRMWRVGCAAGLTHHATLSKAGTFTGATGALHEHLLAGLEQRKDITTLVRLRPALFEPFEGALLTMAEESGSLEATLGELASFFERTHRMILKVKSRLAYPLFLTLVAVWLGPLPLVFRGQGRAYAATVTVGMLGWFFLGGLVLAGRAQAYQRKPAFVRARFARTLSLTLGAGLPLPRAVRLSADAAGDPRLAQHIKRFDERTLANQSLVATLAGAPTLTPDFQGALRVAEETGDFKTTLGRLAELYEDGFR